jgi:FkbH-like protein
MDREPAELTTLTLIADFNIAPLAQQLAGAGLTEDLTTCVAPLGQFRQALNAEIPANQRPGRAFVWVRAESVSPAVNRALQLFPVDFDECLRELDEFIDAVKRFAAGNRSCFVATFVPPAAGYGLLDWRPNLGLANLIARMNLRLAESLAGSTNVFVFDASRWMATSPAPRKLYYAAKVPFSNEVFRAAARDITAALLALSGNSRRLVILDLDNTIWGGVVGETGWQGIRLGGHDHVGEAFQDFQRALQSLTRCGVQLAIVSKNDEAVALEALDQHPEMVLRRADFAAWRINWLDKAHNIQQLLAELNLGAASVIFIDDNPAERDRVRSAFPEILVPDWPEDPSSSVQALEALRCFDTAAISDEDRQRSAMYQADRARREVQATSETDWLGRLGTKVIVEPVSAATISRVEQLFNKTNQLNLTTRRMSGKELLEWATPSNREVVSVTVSDKFGHLGLCGVVGMEFSGADAKVVDYLLSCRVMGRGVEETMFHVAVDRARQSGARQLIVSYSPTPRNAPTLGVLRQSGLTESAENMFTWDCAAEFPKPAHVDLETPR